MKPTTNMIWHICKKDLKLLWPFVLGAAGIQVTSAGLCYAMDHIRVTEALLNISNLLQLGALLASALLIATVVHLDAIPGVRQDWLVRPLSRRDLLLAKVLFVLLLVHRSEEHTSELQSRLHLVCRLLLEKKKTYCIITIRWIYHRRSQDS